MEMLVQAPSSTPEGCQSDYNRIDGRRGMTVRQIAINITTFYSYFINCNGL